MITKGTVSELTNAIATCNYDKLREISTEINDTLKLIKGIKHTLMSVTPPEIGQVSYDVIAAMQQITYEIELINK